MLFSMWIHQLCHHIYCVDAYERKDVDACSLELSNTVNNESGCSSTTMPYAFAMNSGL